MSPERRPRSLLGCALFVLLVAAACTARTPSERIELGAPHESEGVSNPERLSDGRRAFDGTDWNSETAARFHHARSYVDFDLGEMRTIRAVYLQGDNNDEFIVEISKDGRVFEHMWTAGKTGAAGLRARWHVLPERSARYVRLRARGGDLAVTASELQVFSDRPSAWPPRIPVRWNASIINWGALGLLFLGITLGLAVVFDERTSSRARRFLWTAAAVSGGVAAYAITLSWPPKAELINASRAVAAFVSALVVVRLGLWRPLENTRAAHAVLAAMAVLSVATFYNLGHPQFWDMRARAPTYVHSFDQRVYFPSAKYFHELGYDGVYLASVKAYSEDRLNGSLSGVVGKEIRDLRDYELRLIEELAPEIDAVKDRFTPDRWTEFKRDMAYFWGAMGRNAYFDSLRDHGGNATPAWFLVAHLLYRSADANDSVFLWSALVDPMLLLLFFVVAWRTFGLRPALVCMVVFGATTFYQLGSNWGGALLRNDWMVTLGLGVCALRLRRYFLAGVLLGWSAMIRAFPIVALLFVVVWFLTRWFDRRRARENDRADESGRPADFVKLAAGVAAISLALGFASAWTFGLQESWVAWAEKISIHVDDPNVNHVGLTALVGYDPENLWGRLRARNEDPKLWKPLTRQTVRDRWWLRYGGMLLFTGLALVATRRNRLSDAAILGAMMIPIYFYPSNYYLHSIFFWPLLLAVRGDSSSSSRSWAEVAAILLALCALQWFGWFSRGHYNQFLIWSGMLLTAMVAILLTAVATQQRVPAVSPARSESRS